MWAKYQNYAESTSDISLLLRQLQKSEIEGRRLFETGGAIEKNEEKEAAAAIRRGVSQIGSSRGRESMSGISRRAEGHKTGEDCRAAHSVGRPS